MEGLDSTCVDGGLERKNQATSNSKHRNQHVSEKNETAAADRFQFTKTPE